MKKGIFLILSILITFNLTGCGEDHYNAFVFPDSGDLFDYKDIGTFKTLEACQVAAKKELLDIGAEEHGYWQCGKNGKDSRGVISVQACEGLSH